VAKLATADSRVVGFSIFLARSLSWYAIARQAVAAVASSASESSSGVRKILWPAGQASPCRKPAMRLLYATGGCA
jgi:hypothetical protein